VRDDRVALLIIATHNDAHDPLAPEGAGAGKRTVPEKPMRLDWT
jgi:predicted dehydrogenase